MFSWFTDRLKLKESELGVWKSAGCKFSHRHLLEAFAGITPPVGLLHKQYPALRVSVAHLGDLVLRSGRLAAGDPACVIDHSENDFPPPDGCFDETLPPGTYPIDIVSYGDPAALRMRVSDKPVAYLTPAFNAATRKRLDLTGFGVDSAHAAIFSAESLAAVRANPAYHQLDHAQPNTIGAWLETKLPDGNNIFSGKSGKGDGHYYTFWGRDADNEIVAFFIDFRELGKPARMLPTDVQG